MREKRMAAAFTIVQNEPRYLPVWVHYYKSHFDGADLYILDHDSTEVTTSTLLYREREKYGFNVVPVHRCFSFDHNWMRNTVQAFQKFLLQSYDMVLFAEVDEIIAPDPFEFPGGLKDYLKKVDGKSWQVIRMVGHEIIHNERGGEPPIEWMKYPLLAQRSFWADSLLYSKPTLTRVPVNYHLGFHDGYDLMPMRNDLPKLHLLHLHRIDYAYALERHQNNLKRNWSQHDVRIGAGYHNRIVEEHEFREWFYNPDYELLRMEVMPERWKGVL